MHSKPTWLHGEGIRAHRRTVLALSGSIVLLFAMAAIPTGSALGDGTSSAVGGRVASPSTTEPPQIETSKLFSAGELEALLAKLPLADLNTEELVEYLESLPGMSSLESISGLSAAEFHQLLEEAIAELGAGATLGELSNPAKLVPALEASLNELLGGLLGVLGGEGPTHELSESLSSAGTSEEINSLLGSAEGKQQLEELCKLFDGLFEGVSPTKLDELLGAAAPSEPLAFKPATVEEAAQELGTNSTALAKSVGESSSELPSTSTMLIAPVSEGKLVGAIKTPQGLDLDLLGKQVAAETKEGEKSGEGSGEGSGSGSGSGNKSSGSGGSSNAQPTVVVNNVEETPSTPAALSGKSTVKAAKVEIVKHRVKGDVATLVVKVLSAGRLTRWDGT